MTNHFIREHFHKILNKDTDGILTDFDTNLVSIVHAEGTSATMSASAAILLIKRLVREIPFGRKDDVHILVNRCTPDYGVLSIHSSSFAPFLSYTCIVKNGKIAYYTLYIYNPKRELLPFTDTSMKTDRQAKKIFRKHFLAMFTMNPDVITKDYEDSAVVITNMAKTICNGKKEIHSFCSSLMKSSGAIIRHISIRGFPRIMWKTTSVPDGILFLVCEAKAMGTVMTETYYIKDGKIQFESSICGGRMLKTLHEIMK